jgi:multisubunit Na+/H+ antiporter MnhG subunit
MGLEIRKQDVMGAGLFLAGVGLLAGWFFTDKVHTAETVLIIAAVVLMIVGAHLISSAATKQAITDVADVARKVWPGGAKPPDSGGGV